MIFLCGFEAEHARCPVRCTSTLNVQLGRSCFQVPSGYTGGLSINDNVDGSWYDGPLCTIANRITPLPVPRPAAPGRQPARPRGGAVPRRRGTNHAHGRGARARPLDLEVRARSRRASRNFGARRARFSSVSRHTRVHCRCIQIHDPFRTGYRGNGADARRCGCRTGCAEVEGAVTALY